MKNNLQIVPVLMSLKDNVKVERSLRNFELTLRAGEEVVLQNSLEGTASIAIVSNLGNDKVNTEFSIISDK